MSTDKNRSIGWLHLADLHQGLNPQRHLWPNVHARFGEDLERRTHCAAVPANSSPASHGLSRRFDPSRLVPSAYACSDARELAPMREGGVLLHRFPEPLAKSLGELMGRGDIPNGSKGRRQCCPDFRLTRIQQERAIQMNDGITRLV